MGVHGVSNKYKLVTEVLHSSLRESSHSIHSLAFSVTCHASILVSHLLFLSDLEELDDIRDYDESTCEDGPVSRLGFVNDISS